MLEKLCIYEISENSNDWMQRYWQKIKKRRVFPHLNQTRQTLMGDIQTNQQTDQLIDIIAYRVILGSKIKII